MVLVRVLYSLEWSLVLRHKSVFNLQKGRTTMFQLKMLIYNVMFLINFILIQALENAEPSYCEKSMDCQAEPNLDDKNLLFYDVNPPEGFNLRRDVYMRFAIMLAETHKKKKKLNWQLVLPPWYHLYHWKSDRQSSIDPLPWNTFFDLESLKSYVPVVELNEIFSKTNKPLVIDTLYVLQNYDDPFEGGIFVDKWQVNKDNCNYGGNFWGYSNITTKEIVCVRFQGQVSRLWELVSLHPLDKKVMFAHGEIALHDSYGTKPYWDCRKSMQFNRNLVKKAKDYIKHNFRCEKDHCTSYIAVHWRRQDFARSRRNDVPSLYGTASQIASAISLHNLTRKVNKIFIASDAPAGEIRHLDNELAELKFKVYHYVPSKSDLEQYKEGGIAIIDQIICSHASLFIGTHESTFTFRIQEEREILGFDSKTTFNRLCPDTGVCERPSKWTIVT